MPLGRPRDRAPFPGRMWVEQPVRVQFQYNNRLSRCADSHYKGEMVSLEVTVSL